MDNFRDSYFNVTWDLTKKHLRGTFWGKQYDTGRGFAVTIVEGGQVTVPSNETVRLKWEKPDSTEGYVTAVVADDKFLIEDIDQMFTVHGAVRSDLEIWRGGKVISSITFYVSVEKAVAVDAIESSSDFTALQEALSEVGDITEVKSQLAQAPIKPLRYGELKMPSDFTPALPCKFFRDNDGLIKHNMDFNQYKGGTKIYVKTTGNDSTGNGSESTPYRTLTKAINEAVAGSDAKYEIITDIGILNREEASFVGTVSNKTIAFISTSPTKTTISGNATYTWTLDGVGTYKATRSGINGVVDNLNVDMFGLPVPLKLTTTLADCQATKGTFYADGTSVWVHRLDEIIPTASNTIVAISIAGLNPILSNSKVYFENFIFLGRDGGASLQIKENAGVPNSEVCINNSFFVGFIGNGLGIDNVKNTYVFNCIAAYTHLDGFNYHYDGVPLVNRRDCFVLEYNCKAYDIGLTNKNPNLQSNQVSSAHGGINVLRIGTIGWRNTGSTIFDVTGCYSILYDCHAHTPVDIDGVEGVGIVFNFSSDGTGVGLGKTHMINCSAMDCEVALNIGSTHQTFINNFKYEGAINNNGILTYI